MTNRSSLIFSACLPEGFPSKVPPPKFKLGDQVCWHPRPSKDFGTIIGIQFAPAQHLQKWNWLYVVFLALNSPSRSWVQADLAWEEDLLLQNLQTTEPSDTTIGGCEA